MSWDEFRLILAVFETGTLSGAGRRLGMSHATVFRRLQRVEADLGVKLFDRGRAGYVATPAGETVAAAAGRMETQVLDVERRLAGQDQRPSGTVRVTTTDSLLLGFLTPILTSFRKANPEIELEIAVSNEVFDLTRREADVAIRPGPAPPDGLSGRRIGVIEQAVYLRRSARPRGRGATDLQGVAWVGPDGRMRYRALDRWMKANGFDARCRFRVDTVAGMFAAVQGGEGAGVLPCYLGDGDRRLIRIGEPVPALATDLWLLTHPDLRSTARIRAFLGFVADAVMHGASLRMLAGADPVDG